MKKNGLKIQINYNPIQQYPASILLVLYVGLLKLWAVFIWPITNTNDKIIVMS